MFEIFINRFSFFTLAVLALLFTPLSYSYAATEVKLIEDLTKNALNLESIKDLSQSISAIQKTLERKEFLDDPLVWRVKEEAQRSLHEQLLKWLGGETPGQDGQIPFIQNFSDFYQNIEDQVAGAYIFGDETVNQCSEEQTHQARTATLNWYLEKRGDTATQEQNQCQTETAEEELNAMDALFANYTNCERDAGCTVLDKTDGLARRIAAAKANATLEANLSGGFYPTKVCKNIETPGGGTEEKCYIANPLPLKADSTSFLLGELPALQLLQMDEFNEVVSNFMSNLTNQALRGAAGVLGLSGNSEYSQNIFGPEGNLSYADALGQDDISQYQTLGANPIKEALDAEIVYASLQGEILFEIEKLEDRLVENEDEFPSCFDLPLSDELVEAKDNADNNLEVSSTTQAILIVLNDQYENATENSVRTAILGTFYNYENQGYFRTEEENEELELTYINAELARLVDRFRYEMAVERFNCGGNFDYNGDSTATSTATSTAGV